MLLSSHYIPDKSQILFVDYGNTEIVKHTNIRAMKEEFMNHEKLTTLCLIGMNINFQICY